MTLKIGSLFSGYGGLDMAVAEVLGAETAWFCEYDDAPSKILAHHWPDVPNLRDVTKVDWSQVGPVDIITGGSPCQDLSAAGKRAGMTEGTRSNLWVNMREAIIQLQPKLVVWENVQGALSARASSESDMEQQDGSMGVAGGGYLRALGRVLGDLTEAGYDARWATVRASDIGAPHRRARVFLLAYRSGAERGASDLQHLAQAGWTSTEHRERPSESSRCGETFAVAGSFGRGARGAAPGESEGRGPHVEAYRRGDRDGKRAAVAYAPYDGFARPGEAWAGWAGLEDCHSRVNWGQYAPAVRHWERTFGGPAPNPTEPNSNGNPRLNAAFAEWMQGIPAGHVTGPDIALARGHQLKAIGNGVCPPQAAYALRQLLEMETP